MKSKKPIPGKFPFKYKIWLETSSGTGILGDGKIDFLKGTSVNKTKTIRTSS